MTKDQYNISDLLQKPENEFNLGEGALTLAKNRDLNNDFDKPTYVNKLDTMADELKPRIAGKHPEEIISEINYYLFEEQGFGCNSQFFLNKVLDEKKGSCFGLSTLYASLAERLELPIYPVLLPGHEIVRWDDGKFKRNIETTAKGGFFIEDIISIEDDIIIEHIIENIKIPNDISDLLYSLYYNIPKESIEKGVYLRTLSKKEAIGSLLYNIGVTYQSKGNLEAAISNYNEAIKLNPKHAEVYCNIGVIYYKKGDLDRAFQDFTKAIELNPNDVVAYCNIGNVHKDKGNLDAAIQSYTKAIKLDPEDAISYFSRGVAYYKKGNRVAAFQDFTKAIELDPNLVEACRNSGIYTNDNGDLYFPLRHTQDK